jgi:hypothetical protein
MHEIKQLWNVGTFYTEGTSETANALAAIVQQPAVIAPKDIEGINDLWVFRVTEYDYNSGCTWKRDMENVYGTDRTKVFDLAQALSKAMPMMDVFVGRHVRWRLIYQNGIIKREWPEYPYLDNIPADWV